MREEADACKAFRIQTPCLVDHDHRLFNALEGSDQHVIVAGHKRLIRQAVAFSVKIEGNTP